MLLIFITGLLFFFIATNTGYFFTSLFQKNEFGNGGFLKTFLFGILTVTVYLNILSIFIKTDFWLLIPLFVFSFVLFLKPGFRLWLRQMLKQNLQVLFCKKYAFLTLGFLLVILLFTIVPPYNTDSSGYHFLSILWNEKYAVIPGLANLFPQFGYNSSFFVLSAAFSFTEVFHQSTYSINVVLTVLFFCWILKKSYNYNDARTFVLWLMLLVFLRQFPINLASPSADSLASILVFYLLFSVFEMNIQKAGLQEWKSLLLLGAFAVIIKLSTVPLLLVALLPFISRNQGLKKNR